MPSLPTYSVLCFGDSNTWGFIPGTGARYGIDVRWPGVLQQELGPSYRVIEEGFNGRTTIFDDAVTPGRNGQQYLPPCLGSHRPLDAVILFLGLNDLKAQFAASAEDVAQGASTLLQIIQQSGSGADGGAPRTLLMSPPRIGKLTDYTTMFEGSYAKSARLGERMQSVASEAGCEFLDTAGLVATSDLDGIHLDETAHRTLGVAVAQRIRKMI